MISAPLIQFKTDLNSGDISYRLGDIQQADWLFTAVTVSLLTNRRVDRDELLDGDTDQGGCWSDLFLDDGQSKGSRLWLLKREKITPETLERAHDYALEALAWLVDEQHVRRVNVSVEHYRANVLAILVEITRTDRSNWHSRQEFSLNGA